MLTSFTHLFLLAILWISQNTNDSIIILILDQRCHSSLLDLNAAKKMINIAPTMINHLICLLFGIACCCSKLLNESTMMERLAHRIFTSRIVNRIRDVNPFILPINRIAMARDTVNTLKTICNQGAIYK